MITKVKKILPQVLVLVLFIFFIAFLKPNDAIKKTVIKSTLYGFDPPAPGKEDLAPLFRLICDNAVTLK